MAYCIAFAGGAKLAPLNLASTAAGGSMHGFGTERNRFGGAIDVNFRQGAVGFVGAFVIVDFSDGGFMAAAYR